MAEMGQIFAGGQIVAVNTDAKQIKAVVPDNQH